MIANPVASLLRFRRLGWLTGPIFDKELRVSSRRRRNYWLRFSYVILLTVFLGVTWIPFAVTPGSTALFQTQSQMVAKMITRGVVWFQFFGAQVVAVVMMSTAISDEVYGRTLNVLMTTPLSSAQVVLGKLVSRLLQILLLVATTLPPLAIVRVVGGIPWDGVLACFCITLATVVFVGSVSLLFSVLCRRAHMVVVASVLTIGFLFVLLPLLVLAALDIPLWQWPNVKALLSLNPYALFDEWTDRIVSIRPRMLGLVPPSIACCTLLLGASMLLLASSVRLVRRVALRRAMGEPSLVHRLKSRLQRGRGTDEALRSGKIRRVIGPPMVWRELTCVLPRRQRLAAVVVVVSELLLLAVAYTFMAVVAVIGYEGAHGAYILTFLTLAVFFTINTSASLISDEKEARTWLLLLVTPLRDRDILLGKFAGLLRRCGPMWLPLIVYVVLFSLVSIFHPLAILHVLALSFGMLFFLGCTGMYLSCRLGRTTTAATTHLALAGGLWLLVPIALFTATMVLDQVGAIRVDPERIFADVSKFVPFVQGFLLIDPLLTGSVSGFWWAGYGEGAGFLVMLAVVTGGYVSAGLLFIWRAVKAFRRMTSDDRL